MFCHKPVHFSPQMMMMHLEFEKPVHMALDFSKFIDIQNTSSKYNWHLSHEIFLCHGARKHDVISTKAAVMENIEYLLLIWLT